MTVPGGWSKTPAGLHCTMIPIRRLNHAVLYVRDLDRSISFYRRAFGFELVEELPGRAAFLRAAASDNHHDLGLFAVGRSAPTPPPGSVGLYHLAWQVDTIEDLAAAVGTLRELGALVGASDHGASKSLYGVDPDGIEFEIMYLVPREDWGDHEGRAPVMPLDLNRELARYGSRDRR
ncbi:MAG: VOC family protein [Acidimicrobiales bacterium]